MIRFVTRIVSKRVPSSISIFQANKHAFCNTSDNLTTTGSFKDISKYPMTVNFFNILTQYQINKMKGIEINEQDLAYTKNKLQKDAEEIFTSATMEPKVIINMLKQLNQENLLTEQMLKNLITILTTMTHENLYRFTLDFLVTVLRGINFYKFELADTEKETLRSLILFHLGSNKWEFVKDFLDLFTGTSVAKELFNEDIEVKLVSILKYANYQVSNFQFFCSLAFSVYTTLSQNINEGIDFISQVERIVEEKFVIEGITYDINDIENMLFFFPENMVFRSRAMSLLAKNILSFDAKITFDSFRKFLKLSLKNNYVISVHTRDQQEKIFQYIESCEKVEDLRLFSKYIHQINMYAEPSENKERIMKMIRKFNDKLLTEDPYKDLDMILVNYLIDNSTSNEEKQALYKKIQTTIDEVSLDLSFSSLTSIFATALSLNEKFAFQYEAPMALLQDIFNLSDVQSHVKDFNEGVKNILKARFDISKLTEKEEDLLAIVEVLFKTPSFQKDMEFVDCKEVLYILNRAKANNFSTNPVTKSLFEKSFEKYQDLLILEEILLLLPMASELAVIHDDLLPVLFKKATELIKEKEVDMELLLKICRSMSHISHSLLFNSLTRAAAKDFWKACQRKLLKLIFIVEPAIKKNVNPFLEVTSGKTIKETSYLSETLSERDLTILNEIFGYVVSWNMGTQKIFDGFQMIYTKYFDSYKESGLPQIAYSLAELNTFDHGFTNLLENHLIQTKECGSPIDALFYAWYFAIKNNYNQELWNVIMNDLGKLDSIDNVPIKYLMNLYEVLFSIKVEKSYVNIDNLTKFIDKLDEIWENNHTLVDSRFKGVIHSIIEEECYKLEHNTRASLYRVDYMHAGKNVVLVLGNESYVADRKKFLGHIELRKRLLTKLGFNLHVISKKEYLEKKKVQPKMQYVKDVLKGIPRDQKKWKEIRDMKVSTQTKEE